MRPAVSVGFVNFDDHVGEAEASDVNLDVGNSGDDLVFDNLFGLGSNDLGSVPTPSTTTTDAQSIVSDKTLSSALLDNDNSNNDIFFNLDPTTSSNKNNNTFPQSSLSSFPSNITKSTDTNTHQLVDDDDDLLLIPTLPDLLADVCATP